MKNLRAILLITIFLSLAVNARASVMVHLFEWQWSDIASECENVLAPKGYLAVQVSPPQKSVSGGQWWTRYQPVSYAIEGRSGSRAAFADMVRRCNAVGVNIYVDAVINHMAAWDRNFPEVPYGRNDFHNCLTGINYDNAWEVQNCDLVGLNDLATESDYVRGKIAAYLNDLISLGVDGFRIDAAKHIAPADVANIVSRLNGDPYIFQEVIYNGTEAVTPNQYSHIGDITEFFFTNTIGHYFKGRGPLRDLRNIGVWSGWLSTDTAVTFVANHDNQRQNTSNTITHKDGHNVNDIAHVFTLSWPYGYPKVMSSYEWQNHDQGPPAHGASSCNGGWLCEHRRRAIANMVGFRNATQAAFSVSNWWDNGSNQIAYGRGNLGFVVINGENSGSLNATLQTGLPAGIYCNIVVADFNNGSCTGATVTVQSNGTAQFNVGAKQAAAIHVNARVNGGTTPQTFIRLENKAHMHWLQGTHFTDASGQGNNVQSVPAYWTGDKTRWSLVPIAGDAGYFRIENRFFGNWLQATTVNDVTIRQPSTTGDAVTYAVRAAAKSNTNDLTRWRKIDTSDGYFHLQNKSTGYYLQTTPLTDVDGNGFDDGLQTRIVPSYKTGDWTRFKEVPAGN